MPALKSPYDSAFVQQLEPFLPHLEEARFLGGEPFLIRRYYPIWERIAAVNPRLLVSVTTNGTVLTEEVKRTLERLRSHIVLSMDSLDPQLFERIRVNARFASVMEHYGYFKDYTRRKGTDMNFVVCPMRQNWREIPRLLDFCNREEIYLFFNSVITPADSALRMMTHGELAEVVSTLEQKALVEPTSYYVTYNNNAYRNLVDQIRAYRDQKSRHSAFEGEPLAGEWRLSVFENNVAELDWLSRDPETLRVQIERLENRVGWCVQLNRAPVSLRSGRCYLLRFEARSDRPRQLAIGVSRNYEPWDNLGLFTKLDLTPEWRLFELDFVSSSDDDNARIHFDLADSDVSVEISKLALSSMSVLELEARSS